MPNSWIKDYADKNKEKIESMPLENREIFKKYGDYDKNFIPDSGIKDGLEWISFKHDKNVKITKFSELDNIPEVLKKFAARDKIQTIINSSISDGFLIEINNQKETDTNIFIFMSLLNSTANSIGSS